MSQQATETIDVLKANIVEALTGVFSQGPVVAPQILTHQVVLFDPALTTPEAVISTETLLGGTTNIVFAFPSPPSSTTNFVSRVIFNGFNNTLNNCPITLPDFPTDTPPVAPLGVVAYDAGGDLCPMTFALLATEADFITALTTNVTFLCDIASSAAFAACLLANTTFITDLITTLTTNPTFITDIENALLADTAFITALGTALASNATFISSLVGPLTTALTSSATFLTTLATALVGNPTALATLVTGITTAPGFPAAVTAALAGTTPVVAGLDFHIPPTLALPTIMVDTPNTEVDEFPLNQVLPAITNGPGPAPANAAPVLIFQTLPNTAYNFRIAWVVKVPQPLIGLFVSPIGAASGGAGRWLINNYATAIIPGPTVTAGDILPYDITNAGGPLTLTLTAAPGLVPGSVVFYLNNNTALVPAIPAGATFAAAVQVVRTPDIAIPPV